MERKTYVVSYEQFAETHIETVSLSRDEKEKLSLKLQHLSNDDRIDDWTLDSVDEPMSYSTYREKLDKKFGVGEVD